MVEEEDVALGKLAYCTPAPSRAKRGRQEAGLAADERPWWAPERDNGTRTDATATEKRLVCKVYQKLNEWVGRWGAEDADAPLRRNDTWFAENKNGPIRNIASQLLGLSSATVGKYWKEMQENSGILSAAKPRGPQRKNVEDLAIKGASPRDRSLYDIIKDRISHVHSTGHVNTSRNLLKWATEDPDGPQFPNVSARFFRKVLCRLGFAYTRRRKLIVAARRKPYVLRWRKAYCDRRTKRWKGESEYRPRIFLEASFINKNSTGGYTWAPSSEPDGNAVEDKNAGGTGERWTILHALADWRDAEGERRTTLLRDSLFISKGLALSHTEFLPWFESINKTARELSPSEITEIHLDNSRIHLYSADFNPKCSKLKKSDLAQRALGLYKEEMGMGRRKYESQVAHATKPELVALIQSMEGKRTPEIFKIAADYGNVVERTPPYHPEVQPMEYIWSRIKGGYGTRYGPVGIMEFVRSFCEEISELDLTKIVDHCDQIAASMADGEPALVLDDDLAPGGCSGDSDSGDDGAMPPI